MGTVSTQQTRVCLAPGGLAESLLPPYPQQAQVDNSDLHRHQNTGHLGAYIHRLEDTPVLTTATWVHMSLACFTVRCNVLTEKCTEQVCRLLYYHRVDTCVTTPSRKQSSASLLSALPPSRASLICTI